jgi:photosystem II stability/assembly factor-like uncharacterized protein
MVTSACSRNTERCTYAIQRTLDAGATWHRVFTTSEPIDDLVTIPGSPWAWATERTHLLRTPDRGSTWHALPGPAMGSASFATLSRGLAIQPPLFGTKVRLARTNDGGRTWIPFSAPCARDAGFGAAITFPAVDAAWLLCVGEPAAGQESREIFTSSDGGLHWTLTAAEGYHLPAAGRGMPSSGYPSEIRFLADGHGWLSYVGRGYLLGSSDGGSSWRVNHAGKSDVNSIPSVSFVDDSHGWALRLWGGRRSQLLRTADAGTEWATTEVWRSPS